MDPLKDVEAMGRKLGFTLDNGNFHNVSLGQVGGGGGGVCVRVMVCGAECVHV